MIAEDLVGSWRLESFDRTGDGGQVVPGPLGPGPVGFLLYLPDGHMSVSMMRTTPGQPGFMGYSGCWRLTPDAVLHRIVVSSRPDWVGTDQARYVEIDGARLRIAASPSELQGGTGHAVCWRHASAPSP